MWGWIFFFNLFVCSRRLVVEKYLLILKYTVNKEKEINYTLPTQV